MSLIYCPECGHEISANAIACPSCGRPMAPSPPPIVEKPVVVERNVVAMPRPARREGFPPWAFVPIALLGLILLIVLYAVLRNPSDESANVNVNVNAQRRASVDNTRDTRNVSVPTTESQPVSVPPPSVTVPSTTTTVPGTSTEQPQPLPDKSGVAIKAQVMTTSGSTQPARGTKFYLLDKDVETILTEARVEPIEGNTLTGSLGLASVFPDRYSDFQRAAMRAIAAHSKYSGTTGSTGSIDLKNIVPGEYYLFGLARIGHGFALWDAPVSVIPGNNIMNLSPQNITEIPDTTG